MPQDNYVDLPESGGGAGVASLNGETGNVNIVAGSNITVTPSGQSITIASTGGGGISGTWSSTGNVVETNGVNAAKDSGKAAAVGATGSTFALRDSEGNSIFNNSVSVSTTTVSSGQTIAMDSSFSRIQKITGSANTTFTLPDATTLTPSGWTFEFVVNTTGVVTINNNSNTLITTATAGSSLYLVCTNNSTSAGVWDAHWLAPASTIWGTAGLTLGGSSTLSVPSTVTLTSLTASQAVFTDASKNLVSNAVTGTGSVVMSTSPTLTTPNIGAATGTSLSVSGQLTSTVSTGTAPLAVSSTTQVANLNAATAGTSTNIAGGSGGTIPYQSASGTTAMLSNGIAGQLLSSTGGTTAPEWIDAPYDPSLVFNLFEDFSTGFEGTGSGQITSDVAWASVQTGTPTLVCGGTTNIPSDANHPGILVFGTAAGNTTGASITTGVFNGAANQSFVIGGGTLTAEALINIPVLSNGTDDATLTWSLRTNAPNVSEVNGIDITYIHAASNNWIIRSTKASTQTSTTSSTAVTAGWHKLKIVADAAGANINYFIDGVKIGTISSYIPTVNLAPYWAYYKTAGTTTLFAGVDYIRINKVFTTPR